MKVLRTFACGLLVGGTLLHADPALVITAINNKTDAPIAITIAGQSVVLPQDTSISKAVSLDMQPKQITAVGDPLGSSQAWELKHILQIAKAPAYATEMESIDSLIAEKKAKNKEQKTLAANLKRMKSQRDDASEDLAELVQEGESTPDEVDQERASQLALQIKEFDRDIKVTERALRDAKESLAEISQKITKKRAALVEKQKTGKDFQPLFQLLFSTSKQQAYGASFASGIIVIKNQSGQEVASLQEPNLPLPNYAADYIFEASLTLTQDGQQIKPQLTLAKQIRTGSTPVADREIRDPVLDEIDEEEDSDETEEVDE